MIRGYSRVSTVEQVDGSSLDTQRKALEQFGATAFYPDEGISGSVPLSQREMGEELLADAQPGDTIVATKLDRMFRSARDALVMAEHLEDRGVKLVLLDISRDPVNAGGVGKLIFTILAAVAEMERTRIRDRVKEGRQAKKARGGHMGGVAPFGWRVVGSGKAAVLEEVPSQQAALVTIRQAKDAGLSLRDISRVVQEVHGEYVSHVAIARILEREAACGCR